MEKAIFAAGCFWGVEEVFRSLPGVEKTTVGYTGGWTKNPSYHDVCSGNTGHAESVEVVFDPSEISFGELLERFWNCHDPTIPNGQGLDCGSQYRSAIFFTSKQQRKEALGSLEEKQKAYKDPIVTEIAEAGPFYRAEEYHQCYLQKKRGGGFE